MQKSKELKSKFTWRIVITNALLIVLPLIVYILALYSYQNHSTVKEAFHTLNLLEKDQEEFLTKWREFEGELLFLIYRSLDGKEIDQIGESLQFFAKREGMKELFLIEKNKRGLFERTFSSSKLKTPTQFDAMIDRFLLEKTGESFSIMSLPGGDQGLIFAKVVAKTAEGAPQTLIGFTYSLSHLMEEMRRSQGKKEKTLLAFSFERGLILRSDGQKEPIDLKRYFTKTKDMAPFPFSFVMGLSKKEALASWQTALWHFFGYLIALIVVGGSLLAWLVRRFSHPLKELHMTMAAVEKGNHKARFSPKKMGFEINTLGFIFNQTVDELVRREKEVRKERIAKGILARELEIGREVQKALLQDERPPFGSVDIGVSFEPAKELGGDFYDFVLKTEGEDNALLITIADAAGKGVFGCLYSLSLRSLLRGFSETEYGLDTIVRRSGRLFCEDTKDSGVFVTAWLGLLNEKSQELTYTSCGHPSPILRRENGDIERLSTEGMAFGVHPFEAIKMGQVTLSSGDTLFLFTDGILESMNEKGEMFGEKRLLNLCHSAQGDTAEALKESVLKEVHTFAGQKEPHDDITLIVLKI